MERFTPVFEHEGSWWIGYIKKLPGANSQGRTLAEVHENLKEAIKLIIKANRFLTQEGAPI